MKPRIEQIGRTAVSIFGTQKECEETGFPCRAEAEIQILRETCEAETTPEIVQAIEFLSTLQGGSVFVSLRLFDATGTPILFPGTPWEVNGFPDPAMPLVLEDCLPTRWVTYRHWSLLVGDLVAFLAETDPDWNELEDWFLVHGFALPGETDRD